MYVIYSLSLFPLQLFHLSQVYQLFSPRISGVSGGVENVHKSALNITVLHTHNTKLQISAKQKHDPEVDELLSMPRGPGEVKVRIRVRVWVWVWV